MSLQEQDHKGSKKLLNGVEVWTVHTFPPHYTEDGAQGASIVETEDGQFLLLNGEPVKDRNALMGLPEQHRGRALNWWEANYGRGSLPVEPTKDELMAQIQALQAKISSLPEDVPVEMAPEPVPVKPRRNKAAELYKELSGKDFVPEDD